MDFIFKAKFIFKGIIYDLKNHIACILLVDQYFAL